MDGTARPATANTANGGLRFPPEAARRLGCPASLVESAKGLGLPCTAPPPRAPGGIWCVEISPENEGCVHEDNFRRRRAAGHPPTGDPLCGRSIDELDAEDEAVADRECADLNPETRAEVIARWRAGRRSLARSHAIEERVYRDAAPIVHRPHPAPLGHVPRRREPRPRARRSSSSSRTSGADPGDGDGDGESEPAGDLASLTARGSIAGGPE